MDETPTTASSGAGASEDDQPAVVDGRLSAAMKAGWDINARAIGIYRAPYGYVLVLTGRKGEELSVVLSNRQAAGLRADLTKLDDPATSAG